MGRDRLGVAVRRTYLLEDVVEEDPVLLRRIGWLGRDAVEAAGIEKHHTSGR